MSSASWPYLPEQCPGCMYMHAQAQPFLDDAGYEIVGFCRHPRIAMQLFRSRRDLSNAERCPGYVRAAVTARAAQP